MKDELLMEMDTGWHVFNDMALEIMSNFGRSSFLAGRQRMLNWPTDQKTVHTLGE